MEHPDCKWSSRHINGRLQASHIFHDASLNASDFDYNCYHNYSVWASHASEAEITDLQDLIDNYTQGLNGVDSDPLWIAVGTDFHLQSSSPCIEAGETLLGATLDYDGVTLGRGTNPDIGAFETLKGGPRGL